MGCRAEFVQGTVLSLDDVTRAMHHAHGHLKGILQMSTVLRDKSFPRMTKSEWDSAVDPKVKGMWNLHHASISIDTDLDLFVLFSSLSGVMGQYAGANTFIDAFVQYRSNLGLLACAIQIGAVEDEEVGHAAAETEGGGGPCNGIPILVARRLLFPSMSFSEAVEAAMKSTSRNFYLGVRSNMCFRNPGERSLWKGDIRMAAFLNNEDASSIKGEFSSDDLVQRSLHSWLNPGIERGDWLDHGVEPSITAFRA